MFVDVLFIEDNEGSEWPWTFHKVRGGFNGQVLFEIVDKPILVEEVTNKSRKEGKQVRLQHLLVR